MAWLPFQKVVQTIDEQKIERYIQRDKQTIPSGQKSNPPLNYKMVYSGDQSRGTSPELKW